MRKEISTAMLAGLATLAGVEMAGAQTINPATQINWPKVTGSGAPVGSCGSLNYGQPYTDTSGNHQYVCTTSGWLKIDNSGGPPTGSAGGDLSGTYPNPGVAKLSGVPFCTGYTPTNGQAVTLTTASSPNPCYTAVTPASAGITALTGDVAATGPGSAAATLATVNSSPGTCGDATHVCQVTTIGKGLVTSQTQIAISGGGGGSLPSNAVLVFAGDSKNDDDPNAIEPAFALSSFSCTGGTCTVVNTGTNGLAAGDWVNMRFSTAWTSTFSAPTDIALSTGYTLFKVLSTGLSSTQFEFSYSGTGTCSSSCGSAAIASYNLPFNVNRITGLAANPNVVIPSPVTMQELNTAYTTILHPLSEAVTTLPTYFVLGDFENDVSASSAGCNSAATIEAAMQSLWAKIHTDGSNVVIWSDSAFSQSQSSIGTCADIYQIWIALQQWLPLQGKSAANEASGQYWDEFSDVGRSVNDPLNSSLVASNGGFTAGSVNLASAKIAAVLLSGHSDPLDKRPDYFGAGPAQGSAANGFLHVPAADKIYYEQWWDAAMANQIFAIGTAGGYQHLTTNEDSPSTITNSNNGSGTLNMSATFTGQLYPFLTQLVPNLTANGTYSNVWNDMGVASSTNNAFEPNFRYVGPGSTSNYVTLSLKGTNGIKIDGAGNVYIPGIATSATSLPVCPNGTNGGLTTSGCAVGGAYTGTPPIVVTGDAISCPTCSVGSGTSVEINGGSPLGTLSMNGSVPLACEDTSGSGTAQSCTTSPSFTPQSPNCVTYTTTTANSGAGLTVNINSLGAVSVAVPSSGGWTTTLTAGQIPSGTPLHMCYDGTKWNASGTGIQASGGGAAKWVVDDMFESTANFGTSSPGLGPLGLVYSDTNGSLSATGCTAAICAGHPGVWAISTGSATNSFSVLSTAASSSAGNNFLVGSATGTWKIAAEVYTVPGADLAYAVGFGDRSSGPNPTNEISFHCDEYDHSGSTDWWAFTTSGPSSTDTGVSCNQAWHQMEIVVTNETATYYIDNVSVASGVTVGAGNYAIFLSAWNHSSSGAQYMFIDWIATPSNGLAATFQ